MVIIDCEISEYCGDTIMFMSSRYLIIKSSHATRSGRRLSRITLTGDPPQETQDQQLAIISTVLLQLETPKVAGPRQLESSHNLGAPILLRVTYAGSSCGPAFQTMHW